MQVERDLLRDVVSPRLNVLAERYKSAVELIDLRWGINTANVSEEEANRKVLRTCLDEIQRSRPFFIGLLGDRYGWTPPLAEAEAAVAEVGGEISDFDKSVTALEIEYGAIGSEQLASCMFFFRESPDYATLPDNINRIYRDNEDGLSRLTKLKNKIRDNGAQVYTYQCYFKDDEIFPADDWADMITQRISELIVSEWGEPNTESQDWRQEEMEKHVAYCHKLAAQFAGRVKAVDYLSEFALCEKNEDRLLMLKGKAGSGKSSLLAKTALSVIENNDDSIIFVPFFCGLDQRSSTVGNLLRVSIYTLCVKLGLVDQSNEITSFDKLKERFIELLFAAENQDKRVVAIVDALDQLAPDNTTKRMLWISGNLPKSFRLVCSLIDGSEADAIYALGGSIITIDEFRMDDNDIRDVIAQIAGKHRKELPPSVTDELLIKCTDDGGQAAQNPLYINLIVQYLSRMNRYEFEEINRLMDIGLSHSESLAKYMCERIISISGDPEGAYLEILKRVENVIGGRFVHRVAKMIAISRSGLRESDLAGAFEKLGCTFVASDFSWFRKFLEGQLQSGEHMQWNFTHPSMRRALLRSMDKGDDILRNALAEYFTDRQSVEDNFATQEIMHFYWQATKPILAIDVIANFYRHIGSQRAIEYANGLADIFIAQGKPEDCGWIMEILNSCETVNDEVFSKVAQFYVHELFNSLSEDTLQMIHTRKSILLKGYEKLKVSRDSVLLKIKCLYEEQLGRLLHLHLGQLSEAGFYYRIALEEREKIYNKTLSAVDLHYLSASYRYMGYYLFALDQIEEAGYSFRKSIEGFEKVYNQQQTTGSFRNLSVAIYGMGDYLRKLGQIEEAIEYLRRALETSESIYNQTQTIADQTMLSDIYIWMGICLKASGKFEESQEYYHKALEAKELIYNQRHTIVAQRGLVYTLQNMGNNLKQLGKTEEASEYYHKALVASEVIYNKSQTLHDQRSLSNVYSCIGTHFSELGKTEEAGEYYHKALRASEMIYNKTKTLDDHRPLVNKYVSMGIYLKTLGQTEESGEYFHKALDATEMNYNKTLTLADHRDLSYSYEVIGEHLLALGQAGEAGEYLHKALDIREQIVSQEKTTDASRYLTICYNNMGDYLSKAKKYEEAAKYYSKAIEERTILYDQTQTIKDLGSLAYSNNKMGDCLMKLVGQIEEAGRYCYRALEARNKIFNETQLTNDNRNLSISYVSIGDYLDLSGQTEEASVYYHKALEARTKIYNQTQTADDLKDLSDIYSKIGDCLSKSGQTEEAERYYGKSLETTEKKPTQKDA